MERSGKPARSLSAPTQSVTEEEPHEELVAARLQCPVELVLALALVSQLTDGPDVARCLRHVVVTHVDCCFLSLRHVK